MMEPNVNVFGVVFVAVGIAAAIWGFAGASIHRAVGFGGFWLAVLSLVLLIDIRNVR